MASDLHMVTGHDGNVWLDDHLVEGDFNSKVRELLGGDPERHKVLIPGVSQAFYRGPTSVLVMTFGDGVTRMRAEQQVLMIKEGREDTN